jgi:sec-independent protein translocase protein TatC
MPTSDLTIAIGLISVLILLPLGVIIAVRLFRFKEPAPDTVPEFASLRDFWEVNVPHLRELRDRLIKCLIAVAIGTAIGFWIVNSPTLFGNTLPNLLIDHFVPKGITLQFLGPAEGFVNYMRISLVIGVAIAIPVIVYQIVAFFSPGLLPREKRMLFSALPFVTELFMAGLVFGWFFTIPAAMQFLLTYGGGERIETRPSFESFISIISTLLLWNGAIFELPALIFLLAWLGLINTRMLARTRRYAIVIIVITAAIITPTGDPYNLLLLAVPMYLLYELGILLSRLVPRRGTAQPKPTSVEATKT